MPYALLFILLVRGLMLPGASDGIHFYLVPGKDTFLVQQVWSPTQFYSVDFSKSRIDKNRKRVHFQQTHNQGLHQLFFDVVLGPQCLAWQT